MDSHLKSRVGCPHAIHRCSFKIMFYPLHKSFNWHNSIFRQKSSSKLKMQLTRAWQPNIEKMYATQHLKASTSYFCMTMIWVPLGYHMVPKKLNMLSIYDWLRLKGVILIFWKLGNNCWPKLLLSKSPPYRVLFESIYTQDHICKSYSCFCPFQLTKNYVVLPNRINMKHNSN